MNYPNRVLYRRGDTGIQSTVWTDDSGIGRVNYSGYLSGRGIDLSVEEYMDTREGTTGLEVMPFEDALIEIKKAEEKVYDLAGPWVEISEEKYDEMLGCLPPRNWRTVDGVNIFQMSEMTAGNITACYAVYKDKYFYAMRRTTDDYKKLAEQIKGGN